MRFQLNRSMIQTMKGGVWVLALKITLKAARINAGIKQTDAAERVGICPETLSAYETGKQSPTVSTLQKLCEVYRITPDNIFLPKDSVKLKAVD